MYLFHIFYSFLPLRNPIGFGAADFVLFAGTALLVLCTLLGPLMQAFVLKIAVSTRWSFFTLLGLPVALRLLLWPRDPGPGPLWIALLPAAGFCALVYWMLRGWTTPAWAFCGGLLGVLKFGPLSPWMHADLDGLPAALVACLILGVIPRLWHRRARGFGTPKYFSSAPRIFILLCAAQFLFWYALHLCAPDAVLSAMRQYEAWP